MFFSLTVSGDDVCISLDYYEEQLRQCIMEPVLEQATMAVVIIVTT